MKVRAKSPKIKSYIPTNNSLWEFHTTFIIGVVRPKVKGYMLWVQAFKSCKLNELEGRNDQFDPQFEMFQKSHGRQLVLFKSCHEKNWRLFKLLTKIDYLSVFHALRLYTLMLFLYMKKNKAMLKPFWWTLLWGHFTIMRMARAIVHGQGIPPSVITFAYCHSKLLWQRESALPRVYFALIFYIFWEKHHIWLDRIIFSTACNSVTWNIHNFHTTKLQWMTTTLFARSFRRSFFCVSLRCESSSYKYYLIII